MKGTVMRYAWLVVVLVMATVSRGAFEAPKSEEPLWPQGVPDKAIVHSQPEENNVRYSEEAGRSMGGAKNVSVPTLQIFPAPKEKATGAAIVVYPGGGYRNVVLGKEGWDIAMRLNEMGVTAIVVKYRTLPTDPNGNVNWERDGKLVQYIILDGERAVRIARSRAAELGVDPNKIGVMGFSAGAHLAGSVMLEADAGNADSKDPVERVSSRPDFTCMIYGGFDKERFEKAKVSMGPCFFAIAANDNKVEPQGVMESSAMLLKAGVPVELHVFQGGGHGFGVAKTAGTESQWMKILEVWLRQNKFCR